MTAGLTSVRVHAGGLVAVRGAGGTVVVLAATPERPGAGADDAAGAVVVLEGLLGTGARGAARGLGGAVASALVSRCAGGVKSAGPERREPADFTPTASG
ncbi:hypothetical protein V5O49_00245, partial [Isoptericola sp. MSP01]